MSFLRMPCASSLLASGIVVGCGGAAQGPPVAGTADPQVSLANSQGADNAVVDQLTAARCDQEDGCKNIGPGAKFDSRTTCMGGIRGNIGNDLNAYKCPRGIDRAGVDRCMGAIKAEECNHPFETLSRYDACRTGALCLN
jgi:hypothetical protein